MIFEKAHAELMKGKKIRRKEWETLMHLRIIDGKVTAFRGEHSSYYIGCQILTTDGWIVVDGDNTKMTFLEAIEQLKLKKSITKDDWRDKFLFIDKDQIAICHPVEFDFMPTWKCLNSSDWEIMK